MTSSLCANGLIGVLEAKRSLDASNAVRTLKVIGVLFFSLAYTAALFSVAGDYGPGQLHFWGLLGGWVALGCYQCISGWRVVVTNQMGNPSVFGKALVSEFQM